MSLSVRVDLFSIFRKWAGGTESITLSLQDDAMLGDLLNRLGEVYGRDFQSALQLPDGTSLARDVTVLVNGENVLSKDAVHTKLREGDSVAILVSISGG